jgi:ubiquinone/menaquinone biosynthesis C-methylase UbiE
VSRSTAGEFWAQNQPGLRFSAAEVGSRDFFAEVERHRYGLEPAIPEVVRFERWSGADVLEVGCGIATDGIRFTRAGARYTGLDASPAALALARRRFELEHREAVLVEGSADALPFDDARFDLVYSHGVLHHVERTEAAIAELHRVLRPGGAALVMVYHRGSLNYRFTIMVVRRGLAALLLLPGATSAVARLSGERRELLEGHRQLLRQHGLRYLRDRDLFLSNNTDGPGNPLSKVYSRADAVRLFSAFERVQTRVRYLNLRIYPGGERLARTRPARALERRVGWHLYVEAVKR